MTAECLQKRTLNFFLTIVKEKCDHFELSDKNKEKLNHIIDSYRLEVSNSPLAKPINLLIQ